MVQYELFFEDTDAFSVAEELSLLLGIPFEKETLERAGKERAVQSKNNIYLQRDKNNQQFVCVECIAVDYVYPVIVRCFNENAEKVKDLLLKYHREVYKELGQKPFADLQNTYNDPKSRVNWIEGYYKVKL